MPKLGRPIGSITVDPDLKREPISCRVPAWVKRWLESQDNQGKTIEKALIKYYKLKQE